MNLLKAENVQILDHAADWKEAIIQSVLPLEKGGFVTEEYKQAVVANVEEFGPYICIAPHVAMPHARPEQGALQTQVAVTLFREEVSFEREDARANLFIALAAEGATVCRPLALSGSRDEIRRDAVSAMWALLADYINKEI